MQEYQRSLSIGTKHTWDDFDKDAKEHDMDRSGFFQYLYYNYKKNDKRFRFTFDINLMNIMLLLMLIAVLVILVVIK